MVTVRVPVKYGGEDPREKEIRRNYYQPRSLMAEKAASSRAGQVYHTMTSLQDRMGRPDYATDKADTDQLKAIRRDWNRNQKSTPQGMRVAGATSPLDVQNRFRDTTETFRQANPHAYGTMYPFSQGAMKLGESGGLLGLGVRALTGKLGDWKKGITSMIDSSKEEQDEYIAKTFGPNQPFYPEDVHPALTIDEPELTREEQIEKLLVDPGVKTDSELFLEEWRDDEQKRIDDYYDKSEEGGMVFADEPKDDLFVAPPEVVEPLPFDEGREDYIAASGMDPDLLRREKLRGMGETPGNFILGGSPHKDRYGYSPVLDVEFGDNEVAPPPINYRDDPRTESGIANLMPGGALYDRVPMAQRLRLMDTAKRLKEGQHGGMPLSYYGSNWYDEYKRKLENEMEVNRGIRSPMDR